MLKDRSDARVSCQEYEQLYFWTATIHRWISLLEADDYKEIIIGSLRHLSERKVLEIFGFVIMPNHIHAIWRVSRNNSKETPQGSFLKFTAHEFKKRLVDTYGTSALEPFRVKTTNKAYEFWQRDPMAIRLFDLSIAEQKLRYIHQNPAVERWRLVIDPTDYKYSSASFYASGADNFDFLRNMYEAFQFGL